MTKEQQINRRIAEGDVDTNLISDGYHTFGELYDHRIELFIALCRKLAEHEPEKRKVWRSRLHSDGTGFDGFFVMGIGREPGEQITYHLPDTKWEATDFAETLDRALEWDGHTSNDVLKRIARL
jgi:hypothetical protein